MAGEFGARLREAAGRPSTLPPGSGDRRFCAVFHSYRPPWSRARIAKHEPFPRAAAYMCFSQYCDSPMIWSWLAAGTSAVRHSGRSDKVDASRGPVMTASKPDLYRDLAEQLAALLAGEADRIANAANMAALIYHGLPDLNWAGFYFRRGAELVLGPFQGKPACVRIAIGRGVCGIAAARAATVVVPDVHDFPGHIACDPVSRSELVVPLIEGGRVSGMLDLDSPLLARFDEADREGCERLVALFLDHHR